MVTSAMADYRPKKMAETRKVRRPVPAEKRCDWWDGCGLPCPSCGSTRLRVKDSRDNRGTRFRRRECLGCKNRFITKEVVVNMAGEVLAS